MFRIFALFALTLMIFAAPVKAGDFPGQCPNGDQCQENPSDPGQEDPGQEDPGQEDPLPPEEEPAPAPVPAPIQGSLCGGRFEGYYLDDPSRVTFQIRQSGQWGELQVTAWWRGGMWYGQGVCRQTDRYHASIEIYFPGAPVHRGVITGNRRHAQMEGRIDYGRFFRLHRMR